MHGNGTSKCESHIFTHTHICYTYTSAYFSVLFMYLYIYLEKKNLSIYAIQKKFLAYSQLLLSYNTLFMKY